MGAVYESVELGLVVSVALKQFFFFQAEDGIRDVAVTGVQTCALPISSALTATDDCVRLRLVCRASVQLRQPQFHCGTPPPAAERSEEHTSELQSRLHLVCRLLLEKKKQTK